MEVSGQLHATAALNPRERDPGTHWIGGWVGPRAVLDAMVKRKIPSPRRESNPRTPSVQPVAQLENMLQTVDHFETSCLGALFSWLERPRNLTRRDLGCVADVLMGFHRFTFSKPNTELNSDLAPCDFWAFPTMKMELRGKKLRSDRRSAARFREVGGALLEVHRLPREVLQKETVTAPPQSSDSE
jgi:hypothetical protein